MAIITYAQAIKDAICEEMRRDPAVFMLGEDIGVYGGAFGISQGMIEEFGHERIMDTPISEQAIVGAAIGAAICGMRPIAEIMFSDFITVCFDELVNEAPKMRFMSGGRISVPMVMRTASGCGTGAAAHHSQSLEALLAHMPGLKLAAPSTPYDAKGLMKSAIRDDNPVYVLESKLLYKTTGEVPDNDYTVPLGKADIKRRGQDISVITYGRMVQMCTQTAEALFAQGIGIEIIDLRTLVPFDAETVIRSVCKTGRALIVHEAVQFCGFGAEISAQITDSEAFSHLKAPVRRLGALSSPVPLNAELEREAVPTPQKIADACRALMQYK